MCPYDLSEVDVACKLGVENNRMTSADEGPRKSPLLDSITLSCSAGFLCERKFFAQKDYLEFISKRRTILWGHMLTLHSNCRTSKSRKKLGARHQDKLVSCLT